MLQQDMSAWWHNEPQRRVRYEWLAWEALPKSAALAVIAAEDQRFPQHYGLDFRAIHHALKSDRKQRRGASTITQQVVKNLFLWGNRSYIRKGLEASISVLMELMWSKQRILEVYLNIAQFGKRDYGIKAATQFLLKKRSARLSLSKAALLAAVLPAPHHYSVRHPSVQVKRKQRWIQRQMRQLGGLSYLKRL
jgi:monofunctional biosynthetic peptidoglycan transglycosylase